MTGTGEIIHLTDIANQAAKHKLKVTGKCTLCNVPEEQKRQ